MKAPTTRLLADLRGSARLATDATAGLADLVEAMHARIARLPGGQAAPDGRTGGITGLVYKTVRGITRLAGGSVDALLMLLTTALTPAANNDTAALHETELPSAERQALVAALNGVFGDHLQASANPLAIEMALLDDSSRALTLDAAALRQSLPQAGPRLLVLVHGLCMSSWAAPKANSGALRREGDPVTLWAAPKANDGVLRREESPMSPSQWRRASSGGAASDHGRLLAEHAGWTPLYLLYNSGLHIAENGRQFAALMQRLLEAWPLPVERLALLTHSMGGLVARSAVQQASAAGMSWPARLGDLVFLGTPHHGAPLERAGHGLDLLRGATPYAAPLARLGRTRSAGITDLRHGSLSAGDAAGALPLHVPLPDGVRCWAIAATTGARRGGLKDRLLGDGLVPVASALGRHRDPARTLAFTADRQCVIEATHHLQLLSSPKVAERLLQWLQ